jgi:hypothetical protein
MQSTRTVASISSSIAVLLEGLIPVERDNQYTELRHTATHSQMKVMLPQSVLQSCDNNTGVALFTGVTVECSSYVPYGVEVVFFSF